MHFLPIGAHHGRISSAQCVCIVCELYVYVVAYVCVHVYVLVHCERVFTLVKPRDKKKRLDYRSYRPYVFEVQVLTHVCVHDTFWQILT